MDQIESSRRTRIYIREGFSETDLTSPHTDKPAIRSFLETYAEGADSGDVSWTDLRYDGLACSLGVGKYCNLVVHELPVRNKGAAPIDVLNFIQGDGGASERRIRVWSVYSEPMLRQALSIPSDAECLQFPAFALR